jgi:hypothetical protein
MAILSVILAAGNFDLSRSQKITFIIVFAAVWVAAIINFIIKFFR